MGVWVQYKSLSFFFILMWTYLMNWPAAQYMLWDHGFFFNEWNAFLHITASGWDFHFLGFYLSRELYATGRCLCSVSSASVYCLPALVSCAVSLAVRAGQKRELAVRRQQGLHCSWLRQNSASLLDYDGKSVSSLSPLLLKATRDLGLNWCPRG